MYSQNARCVELTTDGYVAVLLECKVCLRTYHIWVCRSTPRMQGVFTYLPHMGMSQHSQNARCVYVLTTYGYVAVLLECKVCLHTYHTWVCRSTPRKQCVFTYLPHMGMSQYSQNARCVYVLTTYGYVAVLLECKVFLRTYHTWVCRSTARKKCVFTYLPHMGMSQYSQNARCVYVLTTHGYVAVLLECKVCLRTYHIWVCSSTPRMQGVFTYLPHMGMSQYSQKAMCVYVLTTHGYVAVLLERKVCLRTYHTWVCRSTPRMQGVFTYLPHMGMSQYSQNARCVYVLTTHGYVTVLLECKVCLRTYHTWVCHSNPRMQGVFTYLPHMGMSQYSQNARCVYVLTTHGYVTVLLECKVCLRTYDTWVCHSTPRMQGVFTHLPHMGMSQYSQNARCVYVLTTHGYVTVLLECKVCLRTYHTWVCHSTPRMQGVFTYLPHMGMSQYSQNARCV